MLNRFDFLNVDGSLLVKDIYTGDNTFYKNVEINAIGRVSNFNTVGYEEGQVYTYLINTGVLLFLSSSHNDDNQHILIKGLNENFEYQEVDQQLNGQTKTQIGDGSILWTRVFSTENISNTNLQGNVYTYEDDTTESVAGVNDTPSKTQSKIGSYSSPSFKSNNKSNIGVYTIPKGYIGILKNIDIQANFGFDQFQGYGVGEVKLQIKEFNKPVFKDLISFSCTVTSLSKKWENPIVLPEKTDITLFSVRDGNVSAHFSLFLIKI